MTTTTTSIPTQRTADTRPAAPANVAWQERDGDLDFGYVSDIYEGE